MKVTKKDIGREIEVAFKDEDQTQIGLIVGVDEGLPVVTIPTFLATAGITRRLDSKEQIVSIGNYATLTMKSHKNTFVV